MAGLLMIWGSRCCACRSKKKKHVKETGALWHIKSEPRARPAVSPSTSCVISNHSRSDIDAQMSKWYPYYTGSANCIQLVISVRCYCGGQIHPCESFVLEERLQKFLNYFTVSYGNTYIARSWCCSMVKIVLAMLLALVMLVLLMLFIPTTVLVQLVFPAILPVYVVLFMSLRVFYTAGVSDSTDGLLAVGISTDKGSATTVDLTWLRISNNDPAISCMKWSEEYSRATGWFVTAKA